MSSHFGSLCSFIKIIIFALVWQSDGTEISYFLQQGAACVYPTPEYLLSSVRDLTQSVTLPCEIQ